MCACVYVYTKALEIITVLSVHPVYERVRCGIHSVTGNVLCWMLSSFSHVAPRYAEGSLPAEIHVQMMMMMKLALVTVVCFVRWWRT